YAGPATAGYSPRFVHAMSPPLKGAKVIDSPAVLSGLRRAANGEPLAILLDGPQGQALSTLPFAQGLLPLSTSAPVPVALVATVGKRLDGRKWKAVQAALLSLAADASAREALDGVRMSGFVALAYAGAIRAKAFRIGREKDGGKRGQLAADAVAVGQLCEQHAAPSPLCDYWLAAALGLQARERSATGHDALPHMVDLLRRAAAADPALDHGGPHRLFAILLLRAPGWPMGPGDVETALP